MRDSRSIGVSACTARAWRRRATSPWECQDRRRSLRHLRPLHSPLPAPLAWSECARRFLPASLRKYYLTNRRLPSCCPLEPFSDGTRRTTPIASRSLRLRFLRSPVSTLSELATHCTLVTRSVASTSAH